MYNWETHIRKEAASQAIERTIQVVENQLGIGFPRGSTPTDSREIMALMLRQIIIQNPG